ncbi:unnamed protein product [Linum trigynum]|uniref:Uncharacterized protein n=1 Tax=Linum trigynum TaxID=586398 RepID=A0AAV2DFG6_9ROSI
MRSHRKDSEKIACKNSASVKNLPPGSTAETATGSLPLRGWSDRSFKNSREGHELWSTNHPSCKIHWSKLLTLLNLY